MAEEVKLFRTWSSPFALRIVLALRLKGIEYETIFEDIANKSPLLLQYNPVYKKVPVLAHNEKPISESLVILEYIEETWKQTPTLLPEDPYEKAMASFWAKFCDDKLFPSVWYVFLKQGKEQEEGIAPATENLKFIEEELKGKKFFGGESIGLVDIAMGYMPNLVSAVEEVTGLKLINEEKFPLLSAWMHNFSDLPIIKENWPPHDKLITSSNPFVKRTKQRLCQNEPVREALYVINFQTSYNLVNKDQIEHFTTRSEVFCVCSFLNNCTWNH